MKQPAIADAADPRMTTNENANAMAKDVKQVVMAIVWLMSSARRWRVDVVADVERAVRRDGE
ncbi:MAG: hypothetical protein WCJ35_03375 [Planctomycetota bacterium]